MLRRFALWMNETKRKFFRSFGMDISTPSGRRAAKWHFYGPELGFLRGLWTNQFEIAPGVWRSNQPSAPRIRKLKAMGVTTILNLRGADVFSYYLFEAEACKEHGITLIDHRIAARRLLGRESFARLFEIFDTIEKPFLLHCKSGADRAGLVSALWLLDQEGATIEQAKAMLSFKYIHLKNTKTGVLDHLLETYEADGSMPVRQWLTTKYDPAAVTASFHAKMGWQAPASA